MQKITTLVFDLGAVILNLKSEQDWFLQDMFANFEQQQLLHLYQQHFFRDFEKGKITPADFIQQLSFIINDKSKSEQQIKSYWNSILLDIPMHRLTLLQQLKQKYRLLLLSNTNHIHVEHIRDYMQNDFGEDILHTTFDHCYFSQEIGFRKPDREIYEYVMREQQLIPSEILFLDDKNENLQEPQKLGWHTFLVKYNNLTASDLHHLL
ncbi:MAG: HAD family phosphatase [Chitinophagales bacterium]|nr:HAD family phosphatase [Chitinophagales bacterium]